MKKLIFFISILVLFIACKTTHSTVKEQEKAKTEVNTNVVTTADVNNQAVTNAVVSDKGNVTEIVEETTTVTQLSAPDVATGMQYPTQTTTTKKVIHRGEQKNISSDTNTTVKNKSETHSADKSDYKSEKSVKTEDKITTEEKTPAWISLGVILVLGILGLFAYLILKRYGLVK